MKPLTTEEVQTWSYGKVHLAQARRRVTALLEERDALKAELTKARQEAVDGLELNYAGWQKERDALRERADSLHAELNAETSRASAALAQVAALRAALYLREQDHNLVSILADTAKAAADHDARIRRETILRTVSVDIKATVGREARRKALEEALACCHEGGEPSLDADWVSASELRALAASEPEGE